MQELNGYIYMLQPALQNLKYMFSKMQTMYLAKSGKIDWKKSKKFGFHANLHLAHFSRQR